MDIYCAPPASVKQTQSVFLYDIRYCDLDVSRQSLTPRLMNILKLRAYNGNRRVRVGTAIERGYRCMRRVHARCINLRLLRPVTSLHLPNIYTLFLSPCRFSTPFLSSFFPASVAILFFRLSSFLLRLGYVQRQFSTSEGTSPPDMSIRHGMVT